MTLTDCIALCLIGRYQKKRIYPATTIEQGEESRDELTHMPNEVNGLLDLTLLYYYMFVNKGNKAK